MAAVNVQLSPAPNVSNHKGQRIKLDDKEISGESSPRHMFPDSFDHPHDAELIIRSCPVVHDGVDTKREEPQYIFPQISSYTNLSSMSTQKWPLSRGQKLSMSDDNKLNKISEMKEIIDTTQDANVCCIGKDIDNCIGLQRIISILSFYSTNYDDSDAIDAYLSKYNMREHLVNDYHHVIDKHLNEDNHSKRKCDKQFELIYKKMMEEQHLFCSIHTCSIWMRNNRQRELSPTIQCVTRDDVKLRMFMDILDTIHCYFMHSVDIGHRIIIQDDHYFDDNMSSCYDARMAFLRRYLAPKKSMQWQKKVAMRNVRFATKFQDNPLTMEGYLRKESMYLKQLRQRYIVLENECLYSYKTDLKEELTECIDLNEFDHVQISVTGPIGQFELIQEDNYNNKRVFIASSMRELDDWLVALKENMLHVKGHAIEEERKCDHHEKEVESIGERYDYWSPDSIYPKYESIKEEVTSNKIYPISMEAFAAAFNKAIHLRTSHKIRNMMICKEVTDEYDLNWYASPRIDHILALVLWTDYRILSAEFRQTFHKISKKIYDEFWIWSKFLIECVNAFGMRLKKSKNKTCFHIIQNNRSSSSKYMQYETAFNAPTSMTTKLEIAILNAPKKNGIILELTNYKKLRYFNCSFVSYFGNEDERLFVEPPHVEKNYYLHVLTIRNLATNENYSGYVNAIRVLDKMLCNGFDKKEICGGGNNSDESVICDKECKANMSGIISILSDEENNGDSTLANFMPSYVMHALEEWSDNILNITFDSYTNNKIVPNIDLYLNSNEMEFDMIQFDKLNVMFKQLISIHFIIYIQASSTNAVMNKMVHYQSIAAMLQRINQLKYSKLNDIRIGYHHKSKHLKSKQDEKEFLFAADWKEYEHVIAAVDGWEMMYIEDEKILQIRQTMN